MSELFLGLGLAWLVYALVFFGIGFAVGRATAKPVDRVRRSARRHAPVSQVYQRELHRRRMGQA